MGQKGEESKSKLKSIQMNTANVKRRPNTEKTTTQETPGDSVKKVAQNSVECEYLSE